MTNASHTGTANATPSRWVLKYDDRVYGPYGLDLIKTYIAEGRVAEHSLLAPEGTPAGATSWQAAIEIPVIASLFLGGENTGDINEEEISSGNITDVPTAAPAATQPGAERIETTYGSAKGQIDRRRQPETANFLIVIDIKARFIGPLEQAIMSLGPAYKLAANVWCVNANATAAGLLNDLSQYIGRTDSMFIADTTRDRTAWSSMGPEVDAKIRRVWRRSY